MEIPGVPVGQQMEQSFLVEISREKKEYLQMYSSFLVFTEMTGISLTEPLTSSH